MSRKLEELFAKAREVMGIEEFRPGQPEALEHILKGKNVLAVMPTGSGKSLLYQLPSLVLPGITAVVSPLIALIKDQIDKMKALGVAVVRIDSTLTIKQKREMVKLARAPGGKLLLTTPERMADPEFRQLLRESAEGVGVSMFVVDEAHCVSQWGHDFRPSYLSLRKAIEDLGNPPILATTATAPPHVRDDILHQLGIDGAEIVTTTFDRPNLHYEVIAVPGDDDKNKTLVTLLKKLPLPGIVYCATVKKVEALWESLARHGIPVAKYHGRLTKKIRTEQQQAFMADGSELVMIATNAFGLGVDKHDIRYVIHYHVPGSLEQYAQEAGRSGRDDKPARCVLFFSPDDVAIQEYFLKGTYPTRRQVRAVYRTLEAWADHDETPPTIPNLALSARVGSPRTRTVLSLLKDEGFVVEHDGGLFEIADPPPDEKQLNTKAKQYEARRIADRRRLDALLEYVRTPGCRSQIILSYLGEIDPPICGRCDNCLRSKEAALEAARAANLLEDGVVRKLQEEDSVAGVPERQRVIRARLIRIDEPTQPAVAAGPNGKAAPVADDELAELVARQAEEARKDWENVFDETGEARPAAAVELEDEYEDEWVEVEEYDEDADEDEDEDEDEYDDEEDEDEDEEDEDEWVIDKTAAALAEEGVDLEDAEITILARKKVPKPPRKTRRELEEPEPARRRKRRRRRRKKTQLPPKSAFTSPVLVKNGAKPIAQPQPSRGAPPPPGGPLVEYVRGPLRINMTPVASATPNDVAPNRKKKRRKRRPVGGPDRPRSVAPTAGAGARAQPAPGGAPQPQDSENGEGKRRRRRRRRKKKPGRSSGLAQDGPVTFFSSAGPSPSSSNGANGLDGQKRKRRRRRRRRRPGGDSVAKAPDAE